MSIQDRIWREGDPKWVWPEGELVPRYRGSQISQQVVVDTLNQLGARELGYIQSLREIEGSLRFYKQRVNELQAIQNRMRDPERTMVCDILANGAPRDKAGIGTYDTIEPDAVVKKLEAELKAHLENLNERDATIADLEAQQRWIPVNERLPEYGVPVLVVGLPQFDQINTALIFDDGQGDGWHWETMTACFPLNDPAAYEWDGDYEFTHWMPLPAEPKEGE